MELFATPNVSMSYEADVATLTIENVAMGIAGIYRCVARNDAGEDEVESKVTVEGQYLMVHVLMILLVQTCYISYVYLVSLLVQH